MPDGEDIHDETPTDTARRRTRWVLLALPILALVVAAGAAIWWFFFRDTAQPEPDIDEALESLGAPEPAPGPDDPLLEVEGTWTMDTDGGTTAGYGIQEEFASIGATIMAGRTPDLNGDW